MAKRVLTGKISFI